MRMDADGRVCPHPPVYPWLAEWLASITLNSNGRVQMKCVELHEIALICIDQQRDQTLTRFARSDSHWFASKPWISLNCTDLHWTASNCIELTWIAIKCIEKHRRACKQQRGQTGTGSRGAIYLSCKCGIAPCMKTFNFGGCLPWSPFCGRFIFSCLFFFCI